MIVMCVIVIFIGLLCKFRLMSSENTWLFFFWGGGVMSLSKDKPLIYFTLNYVR